MSDSFLKLRNYFSNTLCSQIFARIRTVAQVSLPQNWYYANSASQAHLSVLKTSSYKKHLVICKKLEAVSC